MLAEWENLMLFPPGSVPALFHESYRIRITRIVFTRLSVDRQKGHIQCFCGSLSAESGYFF